jgi:spermidine/putrescine transport system ATP-binding protein
VKGCSVGATGSGMLQIENVSKAFHGVRAVEDFNLTVGPGEFVAILGPSGCGKTTLLRIIAGFESPDRGRIVLDGSDITPLPPHKRPLNMVFQRVTLFPHLNVFDNIAFGLRMARVPEAEMRQRVREALELVQLPGFELREVHTLSGGQAQRVALARAIVNRSKVLLFDEPLSALDLHVRRQLQLELKEIHRRTKVTFVYVTHDQEEAMSMADRIVLMKDGRIVQIGSPAELYRYPASLFVANFLGSANLWRGVAVSADGDVVTISADGVLLKGRKGGDVRPGQRAVAVLRWEGARVLAPGSRCDDVSCVAGTIEDVVFVGALTHYRIRAGDTRLTVTRPSIEDGGSFRPGEPVVVAWEAENLRILPDER